MDEMDKREVIRFLEAIEDGRIPAADSYQMVQGFDPLLSYFLLRYLREKHPSADNESGAGERLLELLTTYPAVAKLANTPKDEPMVEWFDDSYSMRAFFNKPQEYVDLIVDKLEG